MIKINLNIKIDDLELKDKEETSFQISKRFIETAFSWIQSRPKNSQVPNSAGLTIKEQRKIYKILDALDNEKEGIISLEDDMYNYLKEVFNKVEWVGATKIVVRIADAIDKKIEEKDGPRSK